MPKFQKQPKNIAKVKDSPHLVRDNHTKAVINTNKSGLAAARMRRKKMLQMNNTIDDINALKIEMTDIKAMLIAIQESLNA